LRYGGASFVIGGSESKANGLGVMVMGVMMIFGGIMFNVFGSMSASSDPFFEDSGFQDIACVMGGGAIVVGIVLLAIGYFAWTKEQDSAVDDSTYEVEPEPQREVVKTYEVIKVRCRYCGTLNEVNAPTCVSCGARL
jgi:hypothetical protein